MGLIQRIRQILQILPDSLNQRVQKCIEIRKEERFVHGKKVEASYDAETDRILLWGRSDISDVDLVIVLMHEIGHFLYHQLLDEKIKKHWLKIHVVENLDFGAELPYRDLDLQKYFRELFSEKDVHGYDKIQAEKEDLASILELDNALNLDKENELREYIKENKDI